MFFEITYDYTAVYTPRGGNKIYSHFTNNQVGREGRTPVGYGITGPSSQFTLEEIPLVMDILKKQLGTTPTLHIHPYPE